MPRQKKIVKYSLTMKLPDRNDGWQTIWENRADYTLDGLLDLVDKRAALAGEASPRMDMLERLTQRGIDDSSWRNPDLDGSRPYYAVARILQYAYPLSKAFNDINDVFFAEYNSRPDLQELYVKFAPEINWAYDTLGHHHARGSYYREQEEKDKAYWQAHDVAPADYYMFQAVYDNGNTRTFREANRETPFQPGDLVKLRTGYIGHPDWDHLFVSRYQAHQTGTTTPDRTVDRIGMVMRVTDTVPWRAAKGTKRIEILWHGNTETSHVPEKCLKWEERPTKKNGQLK